VDPHVLPLGFDPVDVLHRDEEDAVALADSEERGRDVARMDGVLLRPLDGLVEAGPVERLEKVVDRGDFERADGVLVVRGDEDDRLPPVQRVHDVEAVAAGHLDVEQHEIRLFALDRRDRLADIRGFGDHGDVAPRAEERADLVAREALVVDDQGAEHGITISTSNMPSRTP
jgi:hypothetical protein